MSRLLVFQTFPARDQAVRTAALLENQGIPVAVEELNGPLDANFIGQQFSNPFLLKIPGEQFGQARNILMETITVDLEEVDKDYMLLAFNNEELQDILAKPDEWGIYNYKLAEALLKERGMILPKQKLTQLADKRMTELKKPEKASGIWIILGYLAALLATGVGLHNFQIIYIAGLFALATGWALAFTKKTVPDGSRIYVFGKTARTHGLVIFLLGILMYIIHITGALLSK